VGVRQGALEGVVVTMRGLQDPGLRRGGAVSLAGRAGSNGARLDAADMAEVARAAIATCKTAQ
jgi:hypothetical protein